MSPIRIVLRLFLAILCTTAVAQVGGSGGFTGYAPNPSTQQRATTGDITVSGVVVNSITGEPISRALIQMNGMVQRSALTNPEGKFQFDGLPETQAMFSAQKPGFFSDMQLQGPGAGRVRPVSITSGMGQVTVKLTPAGVIAGRITSSDGEPVEGSRVRLKMRMIQNGRRQWIERGGANSDDDGYFRIANLMPGAYYLFTDGGFRPMNTPGPDAYVPAYYPGVNDISGAAALDVRAGITTNADMVLKKEKAYRVEGIVTGLQPGQSANVQLLTTGGDFFPVQASVSPNGNTFEMRRVPAGTYIMKVHAQQRMGPDMVNGFGGGGGGGGRFQPPQAYVGSTTLTVNSDLTGVTVPVQAAANIPVVVRTEFTNAQQTSLQNQTAASRPMYVNVRLTRTDGQPGDFFAQPDGAGQSMTFSIRNVEPGRYRAEFMQMGGNAYVQSATYGSTDILRDEVVIGAGGDQPIEVTLRDDAANLSGTANCPDIQCWVILVPESPGFTPRTVYVNPQGGFQANGLPPGSYRVYAFDRTDGIEFTNPEAMKAYSSKSESVNLSAGQRAQINLELTKVTDQ